MKLLSIVPKLAELALSISPITRPFVQPVKAAFLGLDLAIAAGTVIKEIHDENR
jgi:hypothetical protein